MNTISSVMSTYRLKEMDASIDFFGFLILSYLVTQPWLQVVLAVSALVALALRVYLKYKHDKIERAIESALNDSLRGKLDKENDDE